MTSCIYLNQVETTLKSVAKSAIVPVVSLAISILNTMAHNLLKKAYSMSGSTIPR